MAIATLFMAAVDTQAKYLTGELDPIQIAWSRQSVLLISSLIFLARYGTSSVTQTKHPILQVIRGALSAASAILYITALGYVQLTEAISISFTAPFFILILARIFLRETVSILQWVSIVFGFLGVLVISNPTKMLPFVLVFLLLLEALFFALRQILTKKISETDPIHTTLMITALTAGLLLFLPMVAVFEVPTNFDLSISVSIGLMAGVAELLMIKAITQSKVSKLATVHYTLLIWGGVFGWIFFNNVPDLWIVLGSAMIVFSGVYLANRA